MVYNLMTLYQRSALKRFNIIWKGNFFAPGEGKSELDRHFGQIHFAIDKYLQTLKDLEGDINNLLKAISTNGISAKTYLITPDRKAEPKITATIENSHVLRSYFFEDGVIKSQLATEIGPISIVKFKNLRTRSNTSTSVTGAVSIAPIMENDNS